MYVGFHQPFKGIGRKIFKCGAMLHPCIVDQYGDRAMIGFIRAHLRRHRIMIGHVKGQGIHRDPVVTQGICSIFKRFHVARI